MHALQVDRKMTAWSCAAGPGSARKRSNLASTQFVRVQTRTASGAVCGSDGSGIAPTSLFRPADSFSSHFAAGHLALHSSSSAAETGSWRIAQPQTSLVSFGSLRNTGRAATRKLGASRGIKPQPRIAQQRQAGELINRATSCPRGIKNRSEGLSS